jgi:uncharacterized membrane protein HdeD (DUF308 family)
MLVVRGLFAVLFGILAVFWPGITLLALVTLWGAYALVDGVFAVALAVRAGRAGRRWGWLLFEGLVGIGAAAVTFISPGITALALLTLIAVWAVVTGVAEIAAAIALRREIRGEWLLALSGVVSIAFGVLMLIFPQGGALAVVSILAAYSMLFGALLIALGFRLHGSAKSAARTPPTGGTAASHA